MSPDSNDSVEIYRPGGTMFERRRPRFQPPRISESEKPPNLLAIWNVIRKRRWTVLTAIFVTFGAALIGTLLEKPVYRAKSLLEIDRENPGLVTQEQLLQVNDVSDAYLETQYKILNSDDLAERVIKQLRLDQIEEFRPPLHSWLWNKIAGVLPRLAPSEQSPLEANPLFREGVLTHFQERLDIKPVRRSFAVEVDFESQDPALATRIADTLIADYVQKNLQARWDATQKSSEWLTDQLGDLKTKYEKSEEEMQKYAADNGLLFLETDKGNSENVVDQNLRELQDELTHAQNSRYEKESLYRLIQSGDYASLPGVFDNKLLQDLTYRLADLQREHAQLAATFTESYPRVKEIQSQIAEIQSSLDTERRRAVQKISNDYFAAIHQEDLLQKAFAEKQKEANSVAAKSVQYGILSHDVDSNQKLYDGLLQRLKEASVSAGLKASNIRIVDPAKASYKPVAPIVPLNLGVALAVGLGLGVVVAFLREHLNRTILNAYDVNRFLRVPALGFIPSLESLRAYKQQGARVDGHFTVRINDPKTPAKRTLAVGRRHNEPGVKENSVLSEAFRGLRTSVVLSSGSQAAHAILVTSAEPGEGKTTIAMNLAASLAHLGRRTLLIDADMRCPNVHKYFPQNGSCLSRYLAGEGTWQEMVYQTEVRGLSVLLCGPPPANPAELLSSEGMRNLIKETKSKYDFVVLDSPPLLKVADSRILASLVDSTVLVVKGGETPRQMVQYAESQIRSAGATLLGVVVNNLDVRYTDFPYYAYRRSEDLPSNA